MPELPDLTIVAEELARRVAGRAVQAAAAPTPILVRATPAELETLVGTTIAPRHPPRQVPAPALRARRHGRRASWPPTRCWPAASGSPAALSASGRARACGCASTTARTFATSTARCSASCTSSSPVDLDDIPGWTEMGPDADDPELTLDAFRQRIRRHPGRAEAAAPQPEVRGRHRQRVQRRDPVGGEAGAVSAPQHPDRRADRRPVHEHARGPRRCDRAPPRRSSHPRSRPSTASSSRSICAAGSHARAAAASCARSAGSEATTFCRTCQPPM